MMPAMALRHITDDERRARLVARQCLDPSSRPADPVTLADRIVALHASDPATVYLAARARVDGFEPADMDRALYDDDTLAKHLCMRRTLFVVSAGLLPVVQAACSDAVAARLRRQLAQQVEQGGITDDGVKWLVRAEKATIATLGDLGEATGAQLSRAVPILQARMTFGEGRRWGGEIGVATRVLSLMAIEGRIRRGRPNGSWTSSQHRWQPADPPSGVPPSAPDATAELVRRWLGAFGPGTLDDIVWWTGLGKRKVQAALDTVGAVEVDLDTGTGLVLADDLHEVTAAPPTVALLPSLDPTAMGWKDRRFYGAPQGPGPAAELYDGNGNISPTVWWDGRVVGAWAQRKPPRGDTPGEVRWELHADIGAEGGAAVEEAVASLQTWLGDVVVTTRFPTPVDRRMRS